MNASVSTVAELGDASVPAVAAGFRLQWEQAQGNHVLLYPEGMVKLNRSAGEILSRCDGVATVAQLVSQLEAAFGAQGLRADVIAFLQMARQQGWVRWS
ncbi:pyrroloquinoline quinone biosynthesis peptide chaperone PqqD [Leptothrix discophora]|uniref:PqqA binding protein n=1 Tax=Leptothrix discophora TaxID=89 RepID=A0ABT9G3Y6_LEPDI|nr:pyrroloquinoline quinone biosynthesis peptide chaperone PqqD [Leptothrix discophora]MDP4301193.1 pyrroloquinoline quinone biosynthesis peptide chaperone PqqD [Leptothrix discophora]